MVIWPPMLCTSVISQRQDIIAAQVGVEKNLQKKKKLENNAVTHCELIDDGGFWCHLKFVVDDLKPICLGLNMNQTDAMHPDQALLTFAGIFLYFQKHSKCSVANGMTKRIEKCWKALDQPMFMLALVLNPFEGISHFGDKVATYHHVCSKPPKVPCSENEQQAHEVMQVKKEKEVSEAFLNCISSKGAFKDWIKNKEIFQCVHGDDPLTMWKAFLHTPSISELADFAILLLGISVNQAGLEHSFSDLKIKKTCLCNCLTLPRLKKMAKVGADIHTSQKEARLIEDHMKCHNHDKEIVAELLMVPWYADVLEEYGDQSKDETWQKEMARWVQEEQDQGDDDDDNFADIIYGHQHLKWLPQSLELLFGGRKDTDIDEQKAHTEEARLIDDAEADEERIPDNGELEGSSNNFNG
ncbi:hypothetical protein L208DRAFT_1378509 [Tricholoma matsutake]|nr:hypothetical protein L208DRAFT_1378509 [Tricholoma matsutake 945]